MIDYPVGIKAFYMRLNDDGRTVAAMDCLVRASGKSWAAPQREERLEVLERRIAELDMDAEQYRAYLDLRRFGTCQHAGFGLGFERLVMYLTGVSPISATSSRTRARWATPSSKRAQGPLPPALYRPETVGCLCVRYNGCRSVSGALCRRALRESCVYGILTAGEGHGEALRPS